MSSPSYRWSACPRCLERAKADAAAAEKRFAEQYGRVPLSEFLKLAEDCRETVRLARNLENGNEPNNLRESNGYGVTATEICCDYSAVCQKCGLTLEAEFSTPYSTAEVKPC